MTKKQIDKTQDLMDAAYDRWTEGDLKGTSRYEFLSLLDDTTRFAVVLGNLNYQVENGGWCQWVGNGYCVSYPFVLEALEALGTPIAKKVTAMVETVGLSLEQDVLDGDSESDGSMCNYWNEEASGEYEEQCWSCNGSGENDGYDPDDACSDEECKVCGGDGMTYEENTPPSFSDECDAFYKINEKFMVEVENFLLNQYRSDITKSKVEVS
jgi:hypothetical protein